MHHGPDLETLNQMPTFPGDSSLNVLQPFMFDMAERGNAVLKPKEQGFPISLTRLESTVDIEPAQQYYHSRISDDAKATTRYESSDESRPVLYRTMGNMSIDSPTSFSSSSSLQSVSADGSEITFQFHPKTMQSQFLRGDMVHATDFGSLHASIARTLHELENALLGPDDDETSLANPVHCTAELSLDMDWTDSIPELLSSGSTFSESRAMPLPCHDRDLEVSSFVPAPVKQTSSLNLPSMRQIQSSQAMLDALSSPIQLLILSAEAISDNNLDLAQKVTARLNQVVSIYGDPMERLSAYMVEGLVARVESSGKGLYKALKCKESPNNDLLSAMQIMYEVCPYFKFGYMAANGAIAEAFKDEERVHILDLEIAQGTQWITLIQALGKRPGGPPHVRITGVGDPQAEFAPAGGVQVVGERLAKLAESVNVPFEFHPLPVRLEDLQASMVELSPGEALAVNAALQLHHMPDESVSTSNPRDRLLRLMKSLSPKVMTLVEQEANTNTAPFFPRFMEALSYYSAVFESLDVTLPRESRERVKVEQQCLARDIVNIIACEGAERIERHEVIGKWRARMTMAGFQPYPLSPFVNDTIKSLLESYCNKYVLKEERGALCLGWLKRLLIVASAWH
ncbi:hypothetical protein O6H91_10G082100 [Diphasiastrum complanatum]|nr:hypothetical protein O6H91_10G082100 [Diphasiastrum complanatum]